MTPSARYVRLVGIVIVAGWILGHHETWIRDAVPYDFEYYRDAAQQLARGGSPYSIEGYLYPPLLARLLVPALALPQAWLSTLWTWALALAALVTALCAIRLAKLETSPAAWAVLLSLFSHTVLSGISLGNIQPAITALLVTAALLIPRRPALGGLAVGLAAAIKVSPMLLILYLWVASRRNPSARRAAIAASIALTICSLLPGNYEYVTRSLDGVFIDYKRHAGGNFSWVAYVARLGIHLPAVLPSLCAAAAAFALAAQSGCIERDWGILLALLLIGSPISWAHTYTLLILPTTLALPALRKMLSEHRERRWLAALLWLPPWLILAQCEDFYAPDNAATRLLTPLAPLLLPVALVALLWPTRVNGEASVHTVAEKPQVST